ncbi:MAG: SusC/RagA family TonB-linked outer membrane protein [Cyclobacteriaceae bacterium]
MKPTLSIVLLFFGFMTYGVQDITISGTISDHEGEPVIGATILVTGTRKGVTSNKNGKFEMSIPRDTESLTISSVGFETLVVPVRSETTLNLTLAESTNQLDEVVITGELAITGYGQEQSKDLVSTTVASIKNTSLLMDRPVPSLEGALQGMDPSLIVMQQSGSPGSPVTVRLRGVGTAGDASPLFLYNGFPVQDLSMLNPNDFQSVGIFKDAASAAIYGARGGNGVLNFTSKEGKADKRIQGNILVYAGTQSLVSEGDYMNGREYAQYYNNTYAWHEAQNSLTASLMARPPFTKDEMTLLPNTTWIREISNDVPIREFHIGLSGGKNSTSYYLGAGNLYQGGIIGNTDFNRKTINLKVKTELGKLKISINGLHTNTEQRWINSNLMGIASSMPGIFPVYKRDGEPYNTSDPLRANVNGVNVFSISFNNPIVGLTHSTSLNTNNSSFANALLSYELSPGLTLNTSFGSLSRDLGQKSFSERYDYPSGTLSSDVNSLHEQSVQERNWQWEGYLRHEKSFGDHHLDAVLGTSFLKDESWFEGRHGTDFLANTFSEASFQHQADTGILIVLLPWQVRNTLMSYFGRLNYHFKKKYLFGITLRADGSSKFGPDNRWGRFPSVNAGWVLSEESFFKIPAVSLFKIRGSWGVNGNDRIQPYQWADRYQRFGNVGSEIPRKLDFNPKVKWEEIAQLNLGVDLELFEYKLGIGIDFYHKKTKDMLIAYKNPAFTGLPQPIRNAATVSNKGVEVSVIYRDHIGDFNFDISGNVGFVKNAVTSLAGGIPFLGASSFVFQGIPDLTIADIGTPIASFYGYELDSLDEIGNPVYKDLSGPDGVPDGEIELEYDRKIIGKAYPDMAFGFRLNMDFKGFDMNLFASGYMGNDVVNSSVAYHVVNSNRSRRVLNAWSTENQQSNIMRPSLNEVVNDEYSDYYIEDGSFIKLRTISIGYTFRSELSRKIKLSKVRIYLSGNNLLTLTNYSGYDPEIGSNFDPRNVGIDQGFYPQAKSFLGGIQISF